MSASTRIAQSGTAGGTAAGTSLYFVGPIIDSLFVGGGSLALYVLFLAVPTISLSPLLLTVTAVAVWVCNYPHFAATSYRLYRTPETIRQYPMTALLTPVVIVAAVIACFLSPRVVAPQFVLLYLLWSPYHYSGQTIGITMVYARRGGISLSAAERRTFVTLSVLTIAAGVAKYHTGRDDRHFFGVAFKPLGLPGWVPALLTAAMWASLAVLLLHMVRRLLAGRPPLPLIMLVPVIAQYIWLIAAAPGYFLAAVPLFHSLQYLFVAWNAQLKEAMDTGGRRPSVKFALAESARWLAINVALGFALFWALPHLGGHFGRSLAFSTAVIFVAVQIHHFFVDGVIWKLRNPKSASPLSSSLRVITGRPPAPAYVTNAPRQVAAPRVTLVRTAWRGERP